MTWLIVIALNVTWASPGTVPRVPHIFFKRDPAKPAGSGLGGLRRPMMSGASRSTSKSRSGEGPFGVAQVEQFTWKGLLDFSTCTECGRCQSQCPAWNTGKPLSPKLLVRACATTRTPRAHLLAGAARPDRRGEVHRGAARARSTPCDVPGRTPLIGGAEDGGIIDPDVLLVLHDLRRLRGAVAGGHRARDHIVDMRRYQVLIESSFPAEAGIMRKNLDPRATRGRTAHNTRDDWTKTLDFDRQESCVLGEGETFEYLLWVAAPALSRPRQAHLQGGRDAAAEAASTSRSPARAPPDLTGDPARRMGNEFVFQMLAQQNVEVVQRVGVKKIVATCPHCFNTLKNELRRALGGEYESTTTPSCWPTSWQTGQAAAGRAGRRRDPFHDPCYLGRHNRVSPRRCADNEVGWAGGRCSSENHVTEMPRTPSGRSAAEPAAPACGWRNRIGKRINTERVEEALTTRAKTIAVGCPFCARRCSSTGHREEIQRRAGGRTRGRDCRHGAAPVDQDRG